MSKIYEALLRAELERTRTGVESPIATMDQLLRPRPMPEPELVEEPYNFDFGSQQALAEAKEVEAFLSTLDLSSVPRYPWSPVAAALPALDENGARLEQFRSLRSHLMEFRDTSQLKTVLVSSGLPGEGKSFVTLNLALSFARHKGNRVLLIDGDMRRASLHRALGAQREPGLSEFLSGKLSMLEVMQRAELTSNQVPLPTGIASLTFIGGGQDAENAGDLAANSRFTELIEQVSSHFDWIFVDSSPVNLVSDAVSLARACQGVLLVAREGVTKFKTAQQAQAQFKNVNVLGFVLNAVHKLPVKGDYYGGYASYTTEA